MDISTIARMGMASVVLFAAAMVAWHVHVVHSTEGMSSAGVALYTLSSTAIVVIVFIFILKWREDIFPTRRCRRCP